MEEWDAYLYNGMKTSVVLTRGQPIPDGLFHLIVAVIVQHRDGDILFMQRSLEKPSFPGFWEAGAGGAALKGEDSETAMKRELLEETGIIADPLTFVARQRIDSQACLYDLYIARTAIAKDKISLQDGETIDFRWVPVDELQTFMDSHPIVTYQKALLRAIFL